MCHKTKDYSFSFKRELLSGIFNVFQFARKNKYMNLKQIYICLTKLHERMILPISDQNIANMGLILK